MLPARSRWKVPLLTLAVTILVVWGGGTYAYIYFYPRLIYNSWENYIIRHGVSASSSSGIRINTLYTMLILASPSQTNALEGTGNRDTLYIIGWLDLSKRPEVLHVPDMAGRYYSIQLTDPWERFSPMSAGAPRGLRPVTISSADWAGRASCRLG